MNAEYCYFCDRLTDKAGVGEDSIYISWKDGEIGPLCEECYDGITNNIIESSSEVLMDRDNQLTPLQRESGDGVFITSDNFRLISKDSCYTCKHTYGVTVHIPHNEYRGVCKKDHFNEETATYMQSHICDKYEREENDETTD